MNLIVIYGPPAAGKLTVARELSELTGYKLVDNHTAIDYLAELFPRSEAAYDRVRSQLGRRIRLDIFAAAASAGVNLITTFAPLSPGTQDFLRDIRSVVAQHGGEALFVQLLPDREALLRRVHGESRLGRKIDTAERWHEVVGDNPAAFEPFPDLPHLVLDNTTLSPRQAAEQIIAHYPRLRP